MEIGASVVYDEDEAEKSIPIVHGEHVRDWWSRSDPGEVTRGKVAWSGKDQANSVVRLFWLEWTNPHPEKVTTIDLETRNTSCAPFLVAPTLETK